MLFFEKSSNVKTTNGTFVDGATNVSIHNETHRENRLLAASVPQALHDSSENNKPACFEGTREEHIHSITGWGLGDWKARQARVLWLEGPADVGKSAVAQSYARSIGGKLGAIFFFSRINGWNDPKAFVPTIIYQLATKYPPYRDRVDAVILHDPLVLDKSIEVQFRDLLIQPLQELKGMGIGVDEDAIIIIDGLDECDGTDAQCTIIQIIIASVHEQSTPFLWAFFSRPEPHIMAAFSMIRAKYNFPAVFIWPPEEEIRQLVDQSAGLFIYTASAIRYVANPGASEPTARLRSLLELGNTKTGDNPLANLDQLYTLILEQIPEGTLPNTLLLLSSLTTPTLHLHSVLKITTSNNGVSETLSFYHASFSDFLTDKARSTPRFFVERSHIRPMTMKGAADSLHQITEPTSWVGQAIKKLTGVPADPPCFTCYAHCTEDLKIVLICRWMHYNNYRM
ncbi:hypothetical protein P691DRAFT_790894 [Macrolepiota fuliginosa MF-IS2]|uniref:Nephrocystin 3-like N-terminal domain-containing protein n=1 Tax=Macrolepiota fuliginosa MF-IS2 TaxID=1400762 RepID=A0A9P5X2E0_9AGAR|nr:hypothetical protein P691DRAFT_790894 [Macrolepiota fuliginosa MF-IS2]